MSLKPFWRYYGGKYRMAPRYPKPEHDTIIEPFAGAAGYSMRYPERRIILVERYAVIAEMWRYLIAVSPEEVRRIPLVDSVDDLPDWVPVGARSLVGFRLCDAVVAPKRNLSTGRRKAREMGRKYEGWCAAVRERVASQVEAIRHWQIIEGDYTQAPDIEATWFIDPPYNNRAGSHYVHADVDYPALGVWAAQRYGQVIVCENEGADWMAFQPFAVFRSSIHGKESREVIWHRPTFRAPRKVPA